MIGEKRQESNLRFAAEAGPPAFSRKANPVTAAIIPACRYRLRRTWGKLEIPSDAGFTTLIKDSTSWANLAHSARREWSIQPVKLLLSPVRCPQYNGCAESGIRGAKVNANHVALVNGRPGSWKSEDLSAAREISNRKVRSDGFTPEELFENRIAISEEQRAVFDRAYFRHEKSARERFGIPWAYALGKRERAKVDRWALRRALEECGYLSFRSRRITPVNPGGFRARIQ